MYRRPFAAAVVYLGLWTVHGLEREHDEGGGKRAGKRADGLAAVHPHYLHTGHTGAGRLVDVGVPADIVQRRRARPSVVGVIRRSSQACERIVLAVRAHPVVLLLPPRPRVFGNRQRGR